jgi:hypothetical protein
MMENLEGPLLDIANQLVARGSFSSKEIPNQSCATELLSAGPRHFAAYG